MGKNKKDKSTDDTAAIKPIGESGRMVEERPDGSSVYIARANVGDCYWRVAADVLHSRKGTEASNAEISMFVTKLATFNKKEDANLLLVGEKIEIPPPDQP
jgi:hypothetical protein